MDEMNDIEKGIAELIKLEIEERFDCKVISIKVVYILGTPNVMCKIQYNDDFVYKPCENWTISSLCFSERSAWFTRRIDFFNCMKNLANNN